MSDEAIRIALAAGAYGSAFLFFSYGVYALVNSRSRTQSTNVRWFLCVGTLVVLALIGLDYAKHLRGQEMSKRKLFLSFAPTFSDMKLPDPRVKYLGRAQSIDAPVEIGDDNSSVEISMQAIVEALSELNRRNTDLQEVNVGLQEANVGLTKSLVGYASSDQPTDLLTQIDQAIAEPGKCEDEQVACGWAKLASGDAAAAEAIFKKSIDTGEKEARITAMQGLGEIYIGRGDITEGKALIRRAGSLGSGPAEERLKSLEAIR